MDNMLGKLVRLIVTVPSEMLGALCDLAEKLASSCGSEWYTEFTRFLRKEPCWVAVTETAKKAKTYLRRVYDENTVIIVSATDGTDNYQTAKKVFKGWFDADFENYGIVFSGVAPETDIAVDELVEDGKFPDFLGNSATELERRRLFGSQFVKFCRDHPDKLRKEGFATFFFLTRNDEPVATDLSNVFVALVRVLVDGQLRALVFEFSFDFVWFAKSRPRVVSPQQ